MQLTQLRNATIHLELGPHRLLVDPMLSDPGALPPLRMVGGSGERNPLVPLPPVTDALLDEVTAVLLTHEHPDHLDVAGIEWIRERGLPVWTSGMDAPNLARKDVDAHELVDGSLGMRVEVVPSKHGRGLVGWVLGPVAGFYLAHPGEPSLYLTGDSILTANVLDAIERLQPDVIVAPAGNATLGFGGDILFSPDELVTLAHAARGQVVLNHLEALDHCPVTRAELRERMAAEGLADRVHVPEDGERLVFSASEATEVALHPTRLTPTFQKWATKALAGT
ncbi:MAG: MBL fold metallo-hydrolase [Deltaproteobacteria bacterium]|nr:MBL fold metallo-hydrolase [Deltaproteobacteria bacterium]